MDIESIKISGHGIKGTSTAKRWKSRPWKELACLFIEDRKQSENIGYLLQNYLKEVIEGMNLCIKELKIEKVRIYLSEGYSEFLSELEKYGYEVILSSNSKEIFSEETLVHHAETFLALSRSLAEENYIPKKILTIAGEVKTPGIYEVPFGKSLREIVSQYGNGGEKPIKFVQVGGNTGAIFTEDELDIPFTYSKLMGQGTMLEIAKLEVYNAETCIVNWSYNKMLENSKETCGKCVYCREGIYQLYRIIKDATLGRGKEGDIDLAMELCETIEAGTLCDFGKTAANPLHTAIQKFNDEFQKHIERKRCDALVCKNYITYHILGNKCTGCGKCLSNCSQKAIKGGQDMIHVIDQQLCNKCDVCLKICEAGAIVKAGAIKPKTPEEPVAVGSWKEAGLAKKGLMSRRKLS